MAHITTLEQLWQRYKTPLPIVDQKVIPQLDIHAKTFIEHSPFVVVSSQMENGKLDISPRGGETGFVRVLDNATLLLGDHVGNNRLDTLRNILHNPEVSLMFMIPGIEEVVRIKGRASIHDDESLCAQCVERGVTPHIVVKVTISELFFHCPKAIQSSDLWNIESGVSRDFLPPLDEIVADEIAGKGAF